MNSDKAQEKSASEQLSEVGPRMEAQIYKADKLAFSDINRSRRLGRRPTGLFVGVATGLLKTPKTQLKRTDKNDTALILVLNTFKIAPFTHHEHRGIMTEYSFYSCIRYRNAKTNKI